MVYIGRILKFALQDIARNFGLSFMTVLILVLMLLSVNALWSVRVITNEAVNLIKDQVNVSVYFSAEAGDKNVSEINKYVSAFPEVVKVDLQSAEDVLTSFKQRHSQSKDILGALSELNSNPFGPTMIIKTKEPGDYKKIIKALSVPEYENLIEAKSFDEHESAIEKIQNITSRTEKVVAGLVLLFACISFLIVFNTVRSAIHTQRIEIGIKRLVGASNWFIRGPYLVESFMFSILSLAASIGLLYFALRFIDPYLSVVFPSGFSLTNYYNSNILYVFGVQFVCVLALTILSSGLAMRRQLRI
ncbi:MAG: permease-like cell division protein FtsX [Candidatus Magasanikbacteria bacterium]